MKTSTVIIAFLMVSTLTVSGQWITTGNNIYNTNFGNVGIGTSSPGALLQVENPGTRAFRVYANNSPYGTGLSGDAGGWAFGYNFEGNAGAVLGGFGAWGR